MCKIIQNTYNSELIKEPAIQVEQIKQISQEEQTKRVNKEEQIKKIIREKRTTQEVQPKKNKLYRSDQVGKNPKQFNKP